MKWEKSNSNLILIHKITRGIIWAACILLLLFSYGCSDKQSADVDGSYNEVDSACSAEAAGMPGADMRACCRIYTKTQCSSGFVVVKDSEKIVIAATLHGLSDYDEGSEIVFFDGSSAFGQVFGSDDELDVGFIEIAISDIDKETADGLECVSGPDDEASHKDALDEATDNVAQNSSLVDITRHIYAYDLYPEGSSKTDPKAHKYEGQLISEDEYIYDYDRTMLFGKLERVNDGMSGTPIFSDDGKCLGMIVAANDDGQFAGVFYDEIMKLLYFP